MWRLKVSKGDDDPWLTSFNNHSGRQFWEFDPILGGDEEQLLVEKARGDFVRSHHELTHSSDLLMRIQVTTKLFFFFVHGRLILDYYFLMFLLVCEAKSLWGGCGGAGEGRKGRSEWGKGGENVAKGAEILLDSSGWGWTLAWWLCWPFVSPPIFGTTNLLF